MTKSHVISEEGAAIRVERIDLTDEERQSLTADVERIEPRSARNERRAAFNDVIRLLDQKIDEEVQKQLNYEGDESYDPMYSQALCFKYWQIKEAVIELRDKG